MTPTQKLTRYIAAEPERLFWAFALTHLILWTLIPSLACPNLPLDVVEGYAWGKEWLLGTHKHPPMQAWILETLFDVTGHGRWAPYLASQVAVVTAFWAVWQTGRRIAGEPAALVSAMLLEGIIYYNFTSPEFNPNVLQLPFWALAGWSFHKAVKDNKIVDWFLLGLWAAAGMYTKYSTGLFLMMLAASLFAHRDGRKRLTGIGPYLSVTIAILLFLPHLSWLIDNHFLPLQYAMGRFERYPEHYTALVTTCLMVAGQFLALIFMTLMVVAIYDRRRAPSRKPAASFDRIFLTFASFGPFAATFVLSLVFGYHIRDMWETPFWNFLGLWVVVFLRPSLQPQDLRRFALAWGLVFATGIVLFLANEVLSPFTTTKPKRTNFPGKHLSHILIDQWHAHFHTPLQYVIGDVWPAGNVAWYAEDRPHVYIEGNAEISPWINLADLKKSGAIIVWCMRCGDHLMPDTPSAEIQKQFPQAQIQEPLTLDRITLAQIPPAIIGWAIVPPQTTP